MAACLKGDDSSESRVVGPMEKHRTGRCRVLREPQGMASKLGGRIKSDFPGVRGGG